jgi:uncharacterized coiled-coil protein SlyX
MERRVEDIEVKAAFLEHHVAQLDELLQAALLRLEEVEGQLRALRQQLGSASVQGTLEEEVPPHHVHV